MPLSKGVSSIYAILNLINSKMYIGSAVNTRERWYTHKTSLRYKKHHNKYLQRSWNEYGEANFKFFILEICDKKNLVKREQLWMNYYNSYNPNYGYNLNKTANSMLGYNHTKETKLRLSVIRTGKKHSVKRAFRHHSEESNLKRSVAQKGITKNRNIDKWPHDLGSSCKCNECRIKKLEIHKAWRDRKYGKVKTEFKVYPILQGVTCL